MKQYFLSALIKCHFNTLLSRQTLTAKTAAKLLVLPLLFLVAGSKSFGQGYIYVHKKTLNEESSLDFNFSLTGGPTSVSNFTLNDQPDYINIIDLGADASGGLWAAAGTGGLLYRGSGSSAWVQKVSGNVRRVDGGKTGTSYYILGNAVYYFNGTGSTLVGRPGNVNATDVASNGSYTVVTNSNGALYRVNSSTFTLVSAIPSGVQASYVDMDAAGNIYLREKATSSNPSRVSKLTPGNVFTVYPGGSISGNVADIAVSSDGSTLIQVGPGDQPSGYRYNGSTWIIEPESRGMSALAGGPGQQIWSIFDLPAKPGTIFTRTYTGTGTSSSNSAFWIDDERVRITHKDNSSIIPVSAGTYSLAENIPAGWDVTNITIYDPTNNSTANVSNGSARISVSDGEVVHVVIENTLFQTTPVATNCGNTFTETFGNGATGTVGSALAGLTSYHNAGSVRQVQDGEYSLVSNSGNGGYSNLTDHTAGDGTGRMLLVNASYAKDIFYTRQFTGMVTGASYDLSLWAGSITSGLEPNINMEVYNAADNSLLASVSTGEITIDNKWFNYHLPFTPTTSEIYIVLRNNNIGGNGNDLVIDDISFGLTCDHGDAPESYGTTNANTGVGHIITPSLTIGATVDQEPDGIPNAAALGDDNNGTDDENGVASFPALNVNDTSYDLAVAVNNAIGADAILAGWIDFNRNGIFDDGERTQTAVTGNATSVTLHWTGLSGLSGGPTYARLRLGTVASEITSPTGSAENGEVEDYTLIIKVKVTGNVFNDANGLTDNTVNGTGAATAGLSAVLYDITTGQVAAVAIVASDGTYGFDVIPGDNYSVYITTNSANAGDAAIPVVILPNGWITTGEHIGTDVGNDGSVNGILPLGVITSSITNANFAIEQLPNSDNISVTLASQPIVNQFVTLNGSPSNAPFVTGSDPEDQSVSTTLGGKTVAITSLPAKGELWYNNVKITVGADGINPVSSANPFIISDLDPSLLQIKLTGSGYTSTSFNYAYVDAAGKMDPTPATYILTWASPLPVVLVKFTAIKIDEETQPTALLTWVTTAETNSQRFDIEHSTDGKIWNIIGVVNAQGESQGTITYTFSDNSPAGAQNFYRLKIIDQDGTFAYSRINNLLFDSKSAINVYPNPVSFELSVNASDKTEITKIQIYNTAGQLIIESIKADKPINVSQMTAGIYNVRVIRNNGSADIYKIIISH